MKLLCSLVVCSLAALPALGYEANQPMKKALGGWQLDFTTPEGDHQTPIVIVGRQRDELIAWYIADETTEEFSEVELNDGELSLTFRPQKFNGEVKATFVGRLKKDGECEGNVDYETNDGDSGSFEFTGDKIELSEFDTTTTWDISFTTPDGVQRESSVTALTMGDKTYGWYSSDEYDLPAKELSSSDGEMTVSITVKTEDGETVDVTFRGATENDEISGEAEYNFRGDTGTFLFSGKRAS